MNFAVKTFQPFGILDSISESKLRRNIISAVETRCDIVLRDLQDITLMTSAGLGTLLAALRTVKTKDRKMFNCSINEQLKMLFGMTKMELRFEIFDNSDEFEIAIISPKF